MTTNLLLPDAEIERKARNAHGIQYQDNDKIWRTTHCPAMNTQCRQDCICFVQAKLIGGRKLSNGEKVYSVTQPYCSHAQLSDV